MAINQDLKPVTMQIGAQVLRGRFVNVGGTGQAVQHAAQGTDNFGVSLESVTTAEYNSGEGQRTIAVAPHNAGGRVPVEAGAAIVLGANITTGADGRAETAATGDVIFGTAQEAAGAAGEFITMLMDRKIEASV